MPVHLTFTTIILDVGFSSLSCSHPIESFLHLSWIYESNSRNFKNDNNKAFLPFRTPIAQANYAPQVLGLLRMEQSLLVRIPGKLELLNFWCSKSNSISCCPPTLKFSWFCSSKLTFSATLWSMFASKNLPWIWIRATRFTHLDPFDS